MCRLTSEFGGKLVNVNSICNNKSYRSFLYKKNGKFLLEVNNEVLETMQILSPMGFVVTNFFFFTNLHSYHRITGIQFTSAWHFVVSVLKYYRFSGCYVTLRLIVGNGVYHVGRRRCRSSGSWPGSSWWQLSFVSPSGNLSIYFVHLVYKIMKSCQLRRC